MAVNTHTPYRWRIDDVLKGMMGQPVRVAAEAFSPVGSGAPSGRLIRTSDLILPDNTPIGRMPVFIEGVLEEVSRQIGVVHVRLGPPVEPRTSAEGCIDYRGQNAVILRGPALVRMAIPWRIERIPTSEANYWLDLRLPQVQFALGLAT